ncbi:hypothetical protein DWQ65_05935 [Treponema phagedenis]|uniref:V-type ATPase subunit n=1 Tax=Treponema phagedenis TaxID=162 RepID=A0A0B7GVV1_TREPH|nr:V-type ATPase subunit [Treponema phagedenis]NVP24573.1 V-type ATPase subunit [Treponema phagedenis]QEJ94730.1 V-type ATPase subunit [Treponema phagedenis]QEJ97666.1 V-type ATPase subunit [Treponema phagedenis]QEK00635.1 V-type ATPase subunit [Treponema phagedenis]QEK03235.1 V-type ATPase subunit [Treponema phagedenis]
MDKITADSYLCAKVSGLYSKLYIGERAKRLFEVQRLQELWTLLFTDDLPALTEGQLIALLEQKISRRLIDDFLELVSVYKKPNPIFFTLISQFDYANLRAVSSLPSLHDIKEPPIIDLGQFSIFRWKKWPDINAITAKSPVGWYNRIPDDSNRLDWEIKLDKTYYAQLWDTLLRLPENERASCERLIKEEIILQNIVWVMRLRVYYDFDGKDIIPMLVGSDGGKGENMLCKDAFFALDKPLDSWNAWEGWKYSWILNPHEEGVPWELDPRWAQLAGDKFLYRTAEREFHKQFFTPGLLVAFFKIKQLEEYMIRVAVESLRLGASDSLKNEFVGEEMYV